MQWEEISVPGPGPRMLWPMAWSLLPLVFGMTMVLNRGGLLPIALLASGVMLSFVAVWLGASMVPGVIDMPVLLMSPVVSFLMLFQPHPYLLISMSAFAWLVNYRTADRLSSYSGTRWRIEWDPKILLPEIEGATIFSRRWASRPLMRVEDNLIVGVRDGDRIFIQGLKPLDLDILTESE
tara:strand:- start:20 stop:559 length:540 start_codon:yes stop_codon:yes gene_type:complete